MTGGTEAGLADLRRAVTLDPLSALTHHLLGFGLYLAHRYEEARAANAEAISLEPELLRAHEFRGLADYQLGDLEDARVTCEARPNDRELSGVLRWPTRSWDATPMHKLRLPRSRRCRAIPGVSILDDICAMGRHPKSARMARNRDAPARPGAVASATDPLMDPLRNEPRYRVIEERRSFRTECGRRLTWPS